MTTRAARTVGAGLAAAAIGLLGPVRASALPDLVPEIFNITVATQNVLAGDVVEGCAGGQYDRRLVKFSLKTTNIGPDDLILGDPGCPNCSLNPGAECTNPLFECGAAHGHAHFGAFANSEILDENDQVVAIGHKYGFCLLDLICPNKHYSCSYQGLTAGCSDVYSSGLPCQYIDITDAGLPDGIYKLRVHVNPDGVLSESDQSNNTIETLFTLGQTEQICPTYAASDIPKPIPDLGTATSSVTVPDIGEVTSIRLHMSGTHTYVGDLDAQLTSPSATTRTMFANICGNADNFSLYLGDEAVDPLICPATDPSVLRIPNQSFAPFMGENAAGNWTLTVHDNRSNDTGTLQSWSLEICSICGNGLLDPGEVCDDGNAADGDCCSSDCQTIGPDGASCEDGDSCTVGDTCSGGVCVEGTPLQCDPCLICSSSAGCVVPDIVYPCQEPPSGGSLLMLRHSDDDPTRDSLVWRWRSETPVELDEFGAPDIVTDISLCVYQGDELVMSSTAPAASICDLGALCWDREEHMASYVDPDSLYDGFSSMRIREGTTGKISVRGRGAGLELGDLMLPAPLTVRMLRSDGTPCWQANYDSVLASSERVLKARSR
ncbi:MAG TPA: lysyl oxidase family protein [Candidatus Limnocylindrales bacterium]|nr:lysyl oxidase family protein [Candidatus Limnocylindrales bacterium]